MINKTRSIKVFLINHSIKIIILVMMIVCIIIGILSSIQDTYAETDDITVSFKEYLDMVKESSVIEDYFKLAYTLNSPEQYNEFLERSKELLADEVYTDRITNGYRYDNNRTDVTIQTINKGYSKISEDNFKYHFKFELIKNNVSKTIDCFVITENNIVIQMRGY